MRQSLEPITALGAGIERCQNRDVVIIHMRENVPKFDTLYAGLTPDCEEGEQLKQILMGIHGVTSASSIFKYQIQITKGSMFGWEEVLPRVESALIEFFRGKKDDGKQRQAHRR